MVTKPKNVPRKRGRPAGSKDSSPRKTRSTSKSNAINTSSSGIAYVYDQGFVRWSDPTLDTNKIKMMMRNPYLARPVTQIMNLLFPHGDPVLTVHDSDDHEDEDAAKVLRKMYRTSNCNLKKLAKKCWLSWFYWGPFVYNIVYENHPNEDGWILLNAIRHLPSESFSNFASLSNGLQIVSKSELLPGIIRCNDGNVYYCQRQWDGSTVTLHDVTHEAPPNDLSGDPAGMPICYTVLSLIEMLNFCWACQRQRVQRVGAPSIFLIVSNPIDRKDKNGNVINDLDYAQLVLKNWGRNNLFPLLENMKPVVIPTNESDSAMETINALAKLINDQWSPIGLISTEGSSKIGGGDNAGLDLLRSFRSGFLDPVAEIFVKIAEDVLEQNGFKNYSVYIKFPEFNPQDGELNLKCAQEGRAARDISKNEHRKLIGLGSATDDDLGKFYEEWKTDTAPDPSMQGLSNSTNSDNSNLSTDNTNSDFLSNDQSQDFTQDQGTASEVAA